MVKNIALVGFKNAGKQTLKTKLFDPRQTENIHVKVVDAQDIDSAQLGDHVCVIPTDPHSLEDAAEVVRMLVKKRVARERMFILPNRVRANWRLAEDLAMLSALAPGVHVATSWIQESEFFRLLGSVRTVDECKHNLMELGPKDPMRAEIIHEISSIRLGQSMAPSLERAFIEILNFWRES